MCLDLGCFDIDLARIIMEEKPCSLPALAARPPLQSQGLSYAPLRTQHATALGLEGWPCLWGEALRAGSLWRLQVLGSQVGGWEAPEWS